MLLCCTEVWKCFVCGAALNHYCIKLTMTWRRNPTFSLEASGADSLALCILNTQTIWIDNSYWCWHCVGKALRWSATTDFYSSLKFFYIYFLNIFKIETPNLKTQISGLMPLQPYLAPGFLSVRYHTACVYSRSRLCNASPSYQISNMIKSIQTKIIQKRYLHEIEKKQNY